MTSDDRMFIGVIAICTCIGFLYFSLPDYMIYNLYRDNYVTTNVIIESISSKGRGSERAYFDVVIDGVTYKGNVNRNIWEKRGDTIEIAYNTQHEFVRTQIRYGKWECSISLLCILCTIKYIFEKRKVS